MREFFGPYINKTELKSADKLPEIPRIDSLNSPIREYRAVEIVNGDSIIRFTDRSREVAEDAADSITRETGNKTYVKAVRL